MRLGWEPGEKTAQKTEPAVYSKGILTEQMENREPADTNAYFRDVT